MALARQMDIYCSRLKYLMVQRGLNEMHGYIVHDEGFYQKCKIHELLIKDSCRRAGSMWSYNKKCVEAKKIFSFPPHDDLYLGKTKRMGMTIKKSFSRIVKFVVPGSRFRP